MSCGHVRFVPHEGVWSWNEEFLKAVGDEVSYNLPKMLEPRFFATLGMTAKRFAKNDWERFEILPFGALQYGLMGIG
jgi:hypothetical protein